MPGSLPGWTDFLTAFGLVLVVEGALYALFPPAMKRMAAAMQAIPEEWLRRVGLAAACVGVAVVWLIRH
ncbi:MAG: DUF2065 domain-containing protein [Proteobacteria bacterium]|nr:DUF2065 domain-containing protein [Pseudomonadota bacterium]MBI3499757.1 DUF2065 domain-containing protein [Pseudomonadota bacterium]